jgi:hypothetical protein
MAVGGWALFAALSVLEGTWMLTYLESGRPALSLSVGVVAAFASTALFLHRAADRPLVLPPPVEREPARPSLFLATPESARLEDVVEECGHPVGHAVGRELIGPGRGGSAQAASGGRVEGAGDRGGHGGVVARRDEEPGHTVLDDL